MSKFICGKINISDETIDKVKSLPFVNVPHLNADAFIGQGYLSGSLNNFKRFGDIEIERSGEQEKYKWLDQFRPLDWHDVGILIMESYPGYCVPPHKDHFHFYAKFYKVDPSKVLRRLIFLEDWKDGHYFQVGSQVHTYWSSGDWVQWGKEDTHLGGNFGPANRYTIQVTGVSK